MYAICIKSSHVASGRKETWKKRLRDNLNKKQTGNLNVVGDKVCLPSDVVLEQLQHIDGHANKNAMKMNQPIMDGPSI